MVMKARWRLAFIFLQIPSAIFDCDVKCGGFSYYHYIFQNGTGEKTHQWIDTLSRNSFLVLKKAKKAKKALLSSYIFKEHCYPHTLLQLLSGWVRDSLEFQTTEQLCTLLDHKQEDKNNSQNLFNNRGKIQQSKLFGNLWGKTCHIFLLVDIAKMLSRPSEMHSRLGISRLNSCNS